MSAAAPVAFANVSTTPTGGPPPGDAGGERGTPAKIVQAPPRPATTQPVPVARVAAHIGARVLLGGVERPPAGDTDADGAVVTGVTLRAQHVFGGDLFAALPGSRVHGADYVAGALAAGATAVLTDPAGARRPQLRDSGVPVLVHDDPRGVLGYAAALVYGQPSRHLSVLGVTGTSGKTTTSYLVDAGLRAAGRVTGLVGTVETRVAGERLASAFTTPEAPDLQALFAVMVERGVTDVCMEVSSHALALGRVAGTRFAVGAFTNLSQDHLDFHRDMEDYFAAKAKLFDGRSGTEVVSVDSGWGRRLVRPGTITVSAVSGDADWTVTGVRTLDDGGQAFTARGPGGTAIPISIPLPGVFNIANALLATAMLHSAGVHPGAIGQGLSTVEVPGRMERVTCGQDFTAVVDYSHKPAAVALALDAVRAQLRRAGGGGRVIVVLGCGGDRDAAKRPLMGAEAARRADVLVVTDDNPRGEAPAAIRAAVLAGTRDVPARQRAEVVEIGERRDAIAEAVGRARAGDVVLVAGKGHETGQEIAGLVHPFSDRDELDAAIRARMDQVSAR